MNASRTFVCSALAGLAISAPAFAQWTEEHQVYQIHRIGLYEPANTSPAGLQISEPIVANASGMATGISTRYTPDGTYNGRDAWFFDGLGTRRIGLSGGVYTSPTGFQYSRPEYINEAGQVAGWSYRLDALGSRQGDMSWVFNGVTTIAVGLSGDAYTSADGDYTSVLECFNNAGQAAGYTVRLGAEGYGRDAWLWTGVTLRQIGFTTASHTGVSGRRESYVTALNDSGQMLGNSKLYLAGTDSSTGTDTWIVNGLLTLRLGLVGPGYESTAGYRSTYANLLNASGRVAGVSVRYSGSSHLGFDAWLYDGATTQLIGLFGPAYTSTNGSRSAAPTLINDAGFVAGTTSRFLGDDQMGPDSWFFDGASTRQIGLTGGVYTATDGMSRSGPSILTPGGLVGGYSTRYTALNTENGEDAWVFNGTTTRQVGLTGGAYTGSSGFQWTELWVLHDGARACGISKRFSGAIDDYGQNAWYWTGSTTRLIGMTDATHTGTNGYQRSYVKFQNASGKTVGSSLRYAPSGANNGVTAWYYDPATNSTTPIIGATRLGDSYAYSVISALTDDGFALGVYKVFSGPLDDGQERAFIFRPDRGLTDLGNLVSGGLANSGWDTLISVSFVGITPSIVGTGLVAGQNDGYSAFAMTIPECPACAADYDQDGGVTGGDIGAFFADFETGDSCADVDHDGGVTGGDLGAFFAVYEAGGC